MKHILFNFLKFWAKVYLRRAKPVIVAITGSVGKTSTKEAIYEVLKIKYGEEIRKNEGNLNNETGVPLAILDFKHGPSYGESKLGWIPIIFSAPWKSLFLRKVEVLVLEMAADKPGDIVYLTSIAKPNIAVLTAIAPSHLEAFGTLENIAQEKTGLLRSLDKNGWAVLNLDDELVRKDSYGGWWHKKNYAIRENADIRASEISSQIENFRAQTNYKVTTDKDSFLVSQNTLGQAFVLAGLAAVSVGRILELDNKDITQGLSNFTLAKHRMNVFKGKKGTIILDDCYNANPVSMRAALKVIQDLPKENGRKIVIFGEMREIGTKSNEAHELIGQFASEIADLTISVGKEAKKYNFSKHFETTGEAVEYLLNELENGDILLIKASRGAGDKPMMEPIIDKLKDE